MVYAGKTLEEIAGLTNEQMALIVFRPRDKYGRLKRKKISDRPKIVWMGFEETFRTFKRKQSERLKGHVVDGKVFQGWTEKDIEDQWQAYLAKDRTLAAYIATNKALLAERDKHVREG